MTDRRVTPALATTRRSFPLCGMLVEVLQYEGTVQLGFRRDGWSGGLRDVMANEFVDANTPGQMAELLRYLRRLPLPDAVDYDAAPASGGL